MSQAKKANQNRALILMGIKHCGKSTQGRLLSKHFSCPLYDTDDVIREQTGKTPREIYTDGGEAAFVQAEADACASLAQKIAERTRCSVPFSAVIATGGGICNNPAAVESLRSVGMLVFLNAEEKTAADRIVREVRVAEDGALTNLPAYIARENPQTIDDVRAAFHGFYEARTKKYSALCSVCVQMTSAPPEENMRAILAAIGAR